MNVHPLAIVSLSSSLLAYASAFVGNPLLVWPGVAVALLGAVTGLLARRAIAAAPAATGGKAIATAGLVSGLAFVLLGTALALMVAKGG